MDFFNLTSAARGSVASMLIVASLACNSPLSSTDTATPNPTDSGQARAAPPMLDPPVRENVRVPEDDRCFRDVQTDPDTLTFLWTCDPGWDIATGDVLVGNGYLVRVAGIEGDVLRIEPATILDVFEDGAYDFPAIAEPVSFAFDADIGTSGVAVAGTLASDVTIGLGAEIRGDAMWRFALTAESAPSVSLRVRESPGTADGGTELGDAVEIPFETRVYGVPFSGIVTVRPVAVATNDSAESYETTVTGNGQFTGTIKMWEFGVDGSRLASSSTLAAVRPEHRPTATLTSLDVALQMDLEMFGRPVGTWWHGVIFDGRSTAEGWEFHAGLTEGYELDGNVGAPDLEVASQPLPTWDWYAGDTLWIGPPVLTSGPVPAYIEPGGTTKVRFDGYGFGDIDGVTGEIDDQLAVTSTSTTLGYRLNVWVAAAADATCGTHPLTVRQGPGEWQGVTTTTLTVWDPGSAGCGGTWERSGGDGAWSPASFPETIAVTGAAYRRTLTVSGVPSPVTVYGFGQGRLDVTVNGTPIATLDGCIGGGSVEPLCDCASPISPAVEIAGYLKPGENLIEVQYQPEAESEFKPVLSAKP